MESLQHIEILDTYNKTLSQFAALRQGQGETCLPSVSVGNTAMSICDSKPVLKDMAGGSVVRRHVRSVLPSLRTHYLGPISRLHRHCSFIL
jgi:hypothetical protein